MHIVCLVRKIAGVELGGVMHGVCLVRKIAGVELGDVMHGICLVRKIAGVELGDVMHGVHHGVFFLFKNVILVHGTQTNVIPSVRMSYWYTVRKRMLFFLLPRRKVRLSVGRFYLNSEMHVDILYRISTKTGNNCTN